jgi:GAF domain-containing protein
MLQPITDFLNIFGEATVPMVLLIAFTALFAAKVIVSERSRRTLRSELTSLLKQATTELTADTGLLVFFDRESDELFAEVGVGLDEEFFRRAGSLRRVVETGQSVIVDDLGDDERFLDHPLHDTLKERRIRPVVSVPLEL